MGKTWDAASVLPLQTQSIRKPWRLGLPQTGQTANYCELGFTSTRKRPVNVYRPLLDEPCANQSKRSQTMLTGSNAPTCVLKQKKRVYATPALMHKLTQSSRDYTAAKISFKVALGRITVSTLLGSTL